ncbi:arylesterase [Futiania mangrovi]|uniref:Arylesterase n=1 Tax=Futiania mangrovi TaxID=2959716 RepID=A0A9J6PBL5_9PROT|nr:arylesterase [Futiania mangrovii]MCP1336621.1 arylesterase [Futiania mangrovii]
MQTDTTCAASAALRRGGDDAPSGYGARGRILNAARLRTLWITLAAALWFIALGASAQAEAVRILAFGDSLTAGYGLAQGEGFVPALERELRARGHDVTVIDGGVSGDTTAGGLARLDWSLGERVDAAIVELGANDALRGLPPEAARANLDAILEKLADRGIPVLLAGMRSPPNLGPEYRAAFEPIYPELAEKHGTLLYPFFLDGVAADASLNQADGIHPTAEGVQVIVDRIAPFVEDLIGRVQARAQ